MFSNNFSVQIREDMVIEIARKSIEEKILQNHDWTPNLNLPKYASFTNNQGAFTTIYNLDGSLRGCIGVPYPNHPLGEAIAIAARKAATVDPRFPKVRKDELSMTYIEVEALSPIQMIQFSTTDDLISKIDVGKHGLIVKYGNHAGLLLPKVGARYGWDSLELIKHTCQKAGLPKTAYTFDSIEFYEFTSILYSEKLTNNV